MALFDAQGNEIPGSMTAEEVQETIAEATNAVKQEEAAARQALQIKVEETEAVLEETNKKLNGLDDKDKNFSQLRKLAEDQGKELKSLRDGLDSKITSNVTQIVLNKAREEVITKLSDGDKDLEAKIKIQYDRLIKTEENIDDTVIAKVAAEAYKLSVDTVQTSVLNRVASGKPLGGVATGDSTVDPQVLEAGKAFGLSEEDIKKYGGNK